MKIKKILLTILVCTLIISLSVSTVFAAAKPDKRTPPGLAKKMFDDIDKYQWAVKAIERMKLKGLIQGYGNGIFAPQKPVTKLETIIMALRVMGFEDESRNITELPKKYKGKKVNDWAKGYITKARELGILDDVDMMYFNPQAAAKRHEVAKYVIRALGFEDEAQEHMDEELDFIDASAVPQGSIGYVYLISREYKLMNGYNRRFNPMGSLTRAEMAVLFSRLDNMVDNEIDDDEVIGEVYRIYEDRVVLKIEGKKESFEVDNDVRVYEDDVRIAYSNIKIGSLVRMELEEDKVVYIEIIENNEDKIITGYSGEIYSIDNDNSKAIALKIKEMIIIFKVLEDTKIVFKDGQGKFDELEEGDNVTVICDYKNRAREIKVYRVRNVQKEDKEIEGVITKLDLKGVYHIDIDDKKYELSKEAEVKILGEVAELEELVEGMNAKVVVEEGIVIEIEIDGIEIEGVITKLDLKGVYHIDIDNEKYELSKEAEVKVLGEVAELDDLEEGMNAKIVVEEGIVVEIEVDEVEIEGVITELDLNGVYHIDIDNEKYRLSKEAEVKIEGEVAELDDLEEGMEVKVVVEEGEVIKIDAENLEIIIEGKIIKIYELSSGVKLKIRTEDGLFEYYLRNDVEVEIEDEEEDIGKLEAGQIGEFEILNNKIIKIIIEE